MYEPVSLGARYPHEGQRRKILRCAQDDIDRYPHGGQRRKILRCAQDDIDRSSTYEMRGAPQRGPSHGLR